MFARLRLSAIAAATACVLALGACSSKKPESELGKHEAVREGLAFELDGITYNVFITRQLNLKIPPDEAYFDGPEPKKGEAYYGIFLEACNVEKEPRRTASSFTVQDNQGNEFEPTELEEDNAFAFKQEVLAPEECVPHSGSVADQGPTGGSLLLFKLPISVSENRPLELEITAGTDTRQVELDI